MTEAFVPDALAEALRSVELVMLDVDGVLTRGQKLYSACGLLGLEFDTRDGLGVALLRAVGCTVGIVSNGTSDIIRTRSEDLRLDYVVLGSNNKRQSIEEEVYPRVAVPWDRLLVMGDDIWDIEVMLLAGVSIAPSDAHESILRVAQYVTKRPGGRGAVREMADMVLAAKDIDPLSLLGML